MNKLTMHVTIPNDLNISASGKVEPLALDENRPDHC